jgi:hypothetical protein
MIVSRMAMLATGARTLHEKTVTSSSRWESLPSSEIDLMTFTVRTGRERQLEVAVSRSGFSAMRSARIGR